MSEENNRSSQHSLFTLFRFGAENGVYVGIVLSLCALCLFCSMEYPVLSLLIFPLLLVLIILLTWLLARMARENPAFRLTSPLWMCGIVTFICGSLITALFSAVYMIYVSPGFIERYFMFTLEILSQSTDTAVKGEYDRLLSMGSALPSSMEFVSTMFWTTSFFGSILSLVLALILPRTSLVVPKNKKVD